MQLDLLILMIISFSITGSVPVRPAGLNFPQPEGRRHHVTEALRDCFNKIGQAWRVVSYEKYALTEVSFAKVQVVS